MARHLDKSHLWGLLHLATYKHSNPSTTGLGNPGFCRQNQNLLETDLILFPTRQRSILSQSSLGTKRLGSFCDSQLLALHPISGEIVWRLRFLNHPVSSFQASSPQSEQITHYLLKLDIDQHSKAAPICFLLPLEKQFLRSWLLNLVIEFKFERIKWVESWKWLSRAAAKIFYYFSLYIWAYIEGKWIFFSQCHWRRKHQVGNQVSRDPAMSHIPV